MVSTIASRRTIGFSLLPVLCSIVFACGGDGGSSPTGPSGGVPVTVSFGGATTSATFSAQLNGQTYTALGLHNLTLPVGTHVVSGSYRGISFGVNFIRVSQGGGVESSSVRSLAGADASVRPCGVSYSNIDTPTVERPFRVQFTVTSNAASACQF